MTTQTQHRNWTAYQAKPKLGGLAKLLNDMIADGSLCIALEVNAAESKAKFVPMVVDGKQGIVFLAQVSAADRVATLPKGRRNG